MSRNRTPKAKALVAGAHLKNPKRYRDQPGPAQHIPLGNPYPKMSAAERKVWTEMAADMPWLNRSHRLIVRLACHLTARLETAGDLGLTATRVLTSILSKLGATPVDEAKVSRGPGEPDDPADRFFRKPN